MYTFLSLVSQATSDSGVWSWASAFPGSSSPCGLGFAGGLVGASSPCGLSVGGGLGGAGCIWVLGGSVATGSAVKEGGTEEGWGLSRGRAFDFAAVHLRGAGAAAFHVRAAGVASPRAMHNDGASVFVGGKRSRDGGVADAVVGGPVGFNPDFKRHCQMPPGCFGATSSFTPVFLFGGMPRV